MGVSILEVNLNVHIVRVASLVFTFLKRLSLVKRQYCG